MQTYKLSTSGKWLVSVLGLVMVSSSLVGAIFFWLNDEGRTAGGLAMLMAVCAVFASMGLYLLAVAVFYRVILQADSIEVFEIYRRRYLPRLEIEGRAHFIYGQGMSAWVLVPKPGFGGKIKLSTLLKTDKAFLAWIHSLPDLDLEKKRTAERERSQAVDSIKEQGVAELTLRRVATGLTVAAYALGFGSFLLSDPDHVLAAGVALGGHFVGREVCAVLSIRGTPKQPATGSYPCADRPRAFSGIGRIAKHRPCWVGGAAANFGARKLHAGRRSILA